MISERRRAAEHVAIQVRHANVTVRDEPTQTELHLQDVEGKGYSEGPRAVVDLLRGMLNGGEFRFAAQVDRTAMAMSLKTQFRADDVKLDDGMKILRYVVPVLAGAASTSGAGSMPTSMPRVRALRGGSCVSRWQAMGSLR